MKHKAVARIFEDVNGYYVCDNGKLDTRGRCYKTKIAAIRAAARDGYSQAIGSGCYWDGVKSIRSYN